MSLGDKVLEYQHAAQYRYSYKLPHMVLDLTFNSHPWYNFIHALYNESLQVLNSC